MTTAYQLNSIRYQYDKNFALSLADLAIKAQQTTALIGPNGSGKSTLLYLLAFLITPQQGQLRFKELQVDYPTHPKLRKRVGFLAQKPYLFRGTVLDNINLALKIHAIPKSQRYKKASQAMAQLNISHFSNIQAKQLSDGELQKVALARVLALEPQILILDEPFSYLDQTSTLQLETFIEDYTRQTTNTLIFSTHNRLQGFALADNIIALVNGQQVKTPLINLYHGQIKEHYFDTGKLEILLPGDIKLGSHISIDPHEIVISKQPLNSSIRNCFQGRVITIAEELGKVRISVDAEEIFQVLITREALIELELHLGDNVWVNFKSNSLIIL